MTTPLLQFDAVSRVFQTPVRGEVRALNNVSLQCHEGEITCIVGPSGCGKTTLLRLAAGLDQPSAGTIQIGATRTMLLTQEGALLPWRRVIENIELPLALRKLPRAQRRKRAMEILEAVHLPADVAMSFPHELSGGMRQRASLATALAAEATMLLLDEPFQGVDESTRTKLVGQTLELCKQQGRTILLVTHDIEEALSLADVLVVMRHGGTTTRTRIDLPHPRNRLGREFEQALLTVRAELANAPS
ncbi:MAG: ABC transporter ATP-binding protein [Phycisphaerales bacterium]|jgi:NitT/TauT family transport system ATP-binding protein|nr:ABC transporter ATP-binding protein [Phycisphaerales bacterium]MBT7171435.1 ABC transporter ATP-binding protein [Phycisphaerales bacterium]